MSYSFIFPISGHSTSGNALLLLQFKLELSLPHCHFIMFYYLSSAYHIILVFLAPPTPTPLAGGGGGGAKNTKMSVESRSVPAVVSTSRLLLIFNLWAAECTRCFLYFKWVFPVVNILMLWCMFAVFQCCFVSYVLCVYCAHFHSLHERLSCQNGILFTPPVSFSLRVGPDFKWVLPVADILMLWCIYVVLLRKTAAPHNNGIRFVLFVCVLCTGSCFGWFLH